MVKISYLVGRSVDSRQRLLTEKIASLGSGSILHIVPTKGRVMELETDPLFWPKKRENTLKGVIHQIFEEEIRHERFKGYRNLDDPLRYMLVKKALERRRNQPDGLIYFSSLFRDHEREIDFPGVYRAIAGFFSLLRSNNYQDMFAHDLAGRIIRLEERVYGSGEERYALESDLIWLYGDYEEAKREIKGYDEDDVISSVGDYLKEGGRPEPIGKKDVIVFDGFIHLTRIEEEILFHLFTLADEVWWLVDFDSRTEDPIGELRGSIGRRGREQHDGDGDITPQRDGMEAYRVFAPLVSLMDRLEEAGIESRLERADETAFPNPLAAGVYTNGRMEGTGSNNLKIRSFADRVDEVRAIAREIKRIIHEDGLDVSRDLGRIRVIFPSLKDYSSLISEIFSEYGLPLSLTMGLSLASHPISGLFLYIFKIAVNRFKWEDISGLFSMDLVRAVTDRALAIDFKDHAPLLKEYLLPGDTVFSAEKEIGKESGMDISLFNRVVRRCGLNNMGDGLSGLKGSGLARIRDFYGERFQNVRDPGERDDWRSEYYGFLVQVNHLDHRLRTFYELARQDDPQGISDVFFRILAELGLPDGIVNVPPPETSLETGTLRVIIKRDLKAYSLLSELLLASQRELMVAERLFRIGTGRELLTGFYRAFTQRLNGAYLLDERNPNVIRVSQWLETRGRAFDYVFAGGMTADKFPLREESDFILPDSPGGPFRVLDSVDQSKYLFSHLLRNYRKFLYLSYPGYSEEKEVRPSQALMDLESITTGISPETGPGVLETLFKWEDNPYISSENEMLNACIKKDGFEEGAGEDPFPLKQVLLKRDAPVQGLTRGIRAMVSRWAVDGLFEYDGLVDVADRFDDFLRGRSGLFSPSQLETLANCPMRYLFERVYGLKTFEEPGPEASQRDMGEHIHSILSIFFRRLRDQGKNIADIGLERAFPQAMEAAEEYFTERPFLKRLEFFEPQKRELVGGLDRESRDTSVDIKAREGILARLLRFEENAFGDRIPQGIEYEFGYKDSPMVRFGNTGLRGYIDRFDRDKKDHEMVHVYDYKSGSIPSWSLIKKGLNFQLPVYIRALRTGLKVRRVTAAFYALKKDVFLMEGPLKQVIIDHADEVKGLDISGISLLDQFVDRLMEIVQRGRFHHTVDGMRCRYCEFRFACHKDDRRMERLRDSGKDHGIYSGMDNLGKWGSVDQFRKEWKNVLASMQKALELKTESARQRHTEAVIKFKREMMENRDSLPFHDEYIEELLKKIEEFEKGASKNQSG